MSTPNEGPERGGLTPWTPGDVSGAARALSELGPREQQALGRVIKVAAAVGPMIDAVARCARSIRNTLSRLSDLAQRLYSSGVSRAGQEINNGRQQLDTLKDWTTDKAGELNQQRRDAVSAARDTAVNAKDWAVGKGASMIQGTLNAGRAAVAGGKELAGRTGRWFNAQVSRGAAKASAALAGVAARRSDPTLTAPDQRLQKRDVLLAQKAADLFTAPESQRPAKAAELAAFVQSAYGTEQTAGQERIGGPEQTAEAGNRSVAASHEMAWVLQGNAPAAEIRSSGTATGQEATTSGEQSTPRHRKQEGPSQSGPSRD